MKRGLWMGRKLIGSCLLLMVLLSIGLLVFDNRQTVTNEDLIGLPVPEPVGSIKTSGEKIPIGEKKSVTEARVDFPEEETRSEVTKAAVEKTLPRVIETDPKVPEEKNKSPEKQKKYHHGNCGLDNYNITFLGIEDGKLQMLTVYSINKDRDWKSGTVFIPPETLVPGTRDQSFQELFQTGGPEKIRAVLAQSMEIPIAYFVKVDRNLLSEMEPILEPIEVDGEPVNISQLFTREITPQDELILAALLKKLVKPEVFFGPLPQLIWTCKKYIETDFEVTWSNLWLHYQIACNIDTTKVIKKILPGRYRHEGSRSLWVVEPEGWWNTVYEVTR